MKDNTLNGAVCCIGENKPKYFMKLRNLFLSIEKLGGEISKLDRLVFFMGTPKEEYKRELEQLSVKIMKSAPIHPIFRNNNKVRMLELDLGYDWYVLLDHDTIICDDFSKFLYDIAFKANPVGCSGPDFEFWKKIYKIFSLDLPSKRYTSTSDGKEILPYFNSGVLLIPSCYRKTLYNGWIYYIHGLISIKEQLKQLTIFIDLIDQIALSLALQKTNIPVDPLPVAMNFHTNVPINDMFSPEKIDPYIIHYHGCINKLGCLNPSKYPSVQKRIKEFNELLSQEIFHKKSLKVINI